MKTFYCELCNKQYKNVHEMEMHLDSYDHNHKKVLQDNRMPLSRYFSDSWT